MAKKGLPVKSTKPIPVKIVSDELVATASSDGRERKWKAEDALRTITEAEKHKKDKILMKDVKSLAKERMSDLKKIC